MKVKKSKLVYKPDIHMDEGRKISGIVYGNRSAVTIASTTPAICLHYTDDFIISGIVLTMFRITAIKATFKTLKSLFKASFKNPCAMTP